MGKLEGAEYAGGHVGLQKRAEIGLSSTLGKNSGPLQAPTQSWLEDFAPERRRKRVALRQRSRVSRWAYGDGLTTFSPPPNDPNLKCPKLTSSAQAPFQAGLGLWASSGLALRVTLCSLVAVDLQAPFKGSSKPNLQRMSGVAGYGGYGRRSEAVGRWRAKFEGEVSCTKKSLAVWREQVQHLWKPDQ